MDYSAPEFNLSAFNCSHCNAFSHMIWAILYDASSSGLEAVDVHCATCDSCRGKSIWRDTSIHTHAVHVASSLIEKEQGEMLYPAASIAPMPNPDLPTECQSDYLEARAIVARSPRAAAALLRLVLQKLCKHLGEPGKHINTDVGKLVERGLPKQLQQAFEAIRIVGNQAVHPGELHLDDTPEIVAIMFKLVNMIVTKMITDKNDLDSLYDSLPANALKG